MSLQVGRGEWTRLRIVLDLTRRGPRRASDVADQLDLSAQAVSYQLKQLESEGLVALDDAGIRATQAGIEWLHDLLLDIKRFVDDAVGSLLPLERCTALADEDLEVGDDVGLFMEHGHLVARRADSPSTGVVARSGAAGEVVVVRDLSGIVALEPGHVLACVLPDPLDRAPTADDLLGALEGCGDVGLVCAAGVDAAWLARRAGFEDVVEHAPAAAALDAARSGLDVVIVVAREHAGPVLATLRDGVGGPSGPSLERVDL